MENNQNRKNGKKPGNQNYGVLTLILLITVVVVSLMNSQLRKSQTEQVGYIEFIEMVESGEVDHVDFQGSRIYITPKTSSKEYSRMIQYYTVALADQDLINRLDAAGVDAFATESTMGDVIMEFLVGWLLPSALMIGLLYFMFNRMGGGSGVMGVGKSNAKVYVQKETGVTFADVAGEDEAKESLVEIVDFLHNPQKYTKIGAKLPKGALLVGPPGTGKTLLAKAVAGEAHVPFYSLSGSDFVEMFVGVGASRVRDLFKQAQQSAPSIIFIDEIDAIGRSRDSRFGGNDEREQTLNQLLSEMDGFDSSKGLLVLAATNRPEILDPALLRPGRFDRRVIVEKPDLKGRVEILKVHSKDVRLDETVDFEEIALATSGAVGADLANMMNEAAINAVKHGRLAVSQKDLFESVELVLVGKEKKDRILSKEERRIVSYHEVGHALVTALQKDAEPVQKITIVPRTMGALGYVMQVPEEEKYLNTKKELEAMLVVSLAGRAAEEIVFDTVTTGAANDIEQATRVARAMVTQYGMSEKFGLMGLATQENQYLTGRTVLNCGDATAAEIDEEVMMMLKAAYAEAKRLLSENRDALDHIAEYLIEKETITGKEFMEIFRKVKGIPEPVEGEEKEGSRLGSAPVVPMQNTEVQSPQQMETAPVQQDTPAVQNEESAVEMPAKPTEEPQIPVEPVIKPEDTTENQ
ncbi:MAG: ATP-dependent zinc metalloprotease FtsH [Lachnospiraceae bacterium]|nr:ATP-dependent zinc metalloprotease FtsH [Lachnospiraceae bacterium]